MTDKTEAQEREELAKRLHMIADIRLGTIEARDVRKAAALLRAAQAPAANCEICGQQGHDKSDHAYFAQGFGGAQAPVVGDAVEAAADRMARLRHQRPLRMLDDVVQNSYRELAQVALSSQAPTAVSEEMVEAAKNAVEAYGKLYSVLETGGPFGSAGVKFNQLSWMTFAAAMKALQAALSVQGVGVAEGSRVVPHHPTDEMVLAGREANPTVFNDDVDDTFLNDVVITIWFAMLLAAPEPDRR